ncbi:MAG: S9 family peptidase, partial [Bacillota bacterium]|nr:S9 family peptidase [Bacillota bacterium]
MSQPFTEKDLLQFKFVGDPQVSPDGQWIAFVQTSIDPKENMYRSRIFLAAKDGSQIRQLTQGPRSDQHPRWSPNGRYLAFLSDRDAKMGEEEGMDPLGSQIFVLPVDGGEARRITHIRGGVQEFAWSPDGKTIAFFGITRSGKAYFLPDKKEKPADPDDALFEKYNRTVRVIDRLMYRLDGAGYFEDRRRHIFLLDVAEALEASLESLPRPRQVTDGDYDHQGLSFSPDGRYLATSSARVPNADEVEFSDIWIFDTEGKEAPRAVTESDGPYHSAAWSPDGKTIAFLGHQLELDWYTDTKLFAVSSQGGSRRRLAESFSRTFGDASAVDMRMVGGQQGPIWSHDGQSLFLLGSDRGSTHLYQVDAQEGSIQRLTHGDVVLYGFSLSAHEELVAWSQAGPAYPGDIFAAPLATLAKGRAPAGSPPLEGETKGALRLTEINKEILQDKAIALPERYTFSAPGGPQVDGWVIRPPQKEGKVPVLLEIHGGPMTQYTSSFFFEFQLLASRGFAIVYTNPRGSQGYGQEFCAGIRGDWGVNDYADIMAGLDEALKRYDFLDEARMGVLGGSYGGYMTAWIIGHTQRFKAACAMRS